MSSSALNAYQYKKTICASEFFVPDLLDYSCFLYLKFQVAASLFQTSSQVNCSFEMEGFVET
jgi:hypothetical protein